MQKYHKIISLVFSITFLICLQEFPVDRPLFRILGLALLVWLVLLGFYNHWYLRIIQKYNFWMWLKPLLFFFSSFALFLIIPSYFFRGAFLLVVVALGAFFEAFLGNYSENVLLSEYLITSFGFFVALCAYNFYFPKFYGLYLTCVFAVSFVITRSFYEFVPQSNHTKTVAALILGLFCSEFFWALNFLPLHFSATAFLLFNLFYFCLILNYYFLFHTLSVKKIQFHLLLVVICSAAVLIATPWRILT